MCGRRLAVKHFLAWRRLRSGAVMCLASHEGVSCQLALIDTVSMAVLGMSATIGRCSKCHFRLGAFRRQQRAAVMAGRSSMFAGSFPFARPRLDCRECCGTLQ